MNTTSDNNIMAKPNLSNSIAKYRHTIPAHIAYLVTAAYAKMPIGHDEEHAYDVWGNAQYILTQLDIKLTPIERILFYYIILLHDAHDHKFAKSGRCLDIDDLRAKYRLALGIDLYAAIYDIINNGHELSAFLARFKQELHINIVSGQLSNCIIDYILSQLLDQCVDIIIHIHTNCSWSKRAISKPVESNLCRDILRRVLQDADWLQAIGHVGIFRCREYQTEYHGTDDVDKHIYAHIHEKILHIPAGMNFDVTRAIIVERDLMTPIHEFIADYDHKMRGLDKIPANENHQTEPIASMNIAVDKAGGINIIAINDKPTRISSIDDTIWFESGIRGFSTPSEPSEAILIEPQTPSRYLVQRLSKK